MLEGGEVEGNIVRGIEAVGLAIVERLADSCEVPGDLLRNASARDELTRLEKKPIYSLTFARRISKLTQH